MSKLTFTYQHSFTSTHILELEQMEAALKLMQEKAAGNHYENAKDKALTGLMLEAYKVAGINGFSMEFARLINREVLNVNNEQMFAGDDMKVSPVKTVLVVDKSEDLNG